MAFHLIVLFFNCLQQNCLKYGRIVWTQASRRFQHSLTAVSIMFCFRLILTPPVTSWIYKHCWKSIGRHPALWQLNLVIDWLLGSEIWIDKFIEVFLFSSTHDWLGRVSPDSAKAKLGVVRT